MEQKEFEFGTTYKVTVVSSSTSVIIVAQEEIKECFVLIGHGIKQEDLPKIQEKGTIVFERGGVKGGYWKYNKIINNGKE